MPLYLDVTEVQPGMILASDICSENGSVLLKSGMTLTSKYLEKLSSRGKSRVAVLVEGETPSTETNLYEKTTEGFRYELDSMFTNIERTGVMTKEMIDKITDRVTNVVRYIFEEDSTLNIMKQLRSIGTYDKYTLGHSIGVMMSALLLARQCEEKGYIVLDYQDRVNIGVGSILHDIGKLRIPKEVLNKPFGFTPEEWLIMKCHPKHGIDIVREFDSVMPMARGIVIHHHQKWNGKGYGISDDGILSGEDIPKAIRIASVADVLDALTSNRPYRKGMVMAQALSLIEHDFGSHFDPEIKSIVFHTYIPFPIGTILLTEDGLISVVSEVDNFLRPVVTVLSVLDFGKKILLEKNLMKGQKIKIENPRGRILDAARTLEEMKLILLEKYALEEKQIADFAGTTMAAS